MSFRPVTTRASRRTQLDASCSSGSSSAPRNNRRGSFELPPGLAYFRTKKAGRRSAALRKGDALHGYHSTRLPAPCAVYIREGTVESEEEFEKSVVPVVQPGNTNLADIIDPVKDDMEQMKVNLRNVVGERHPMLMAAADQIFGAGGKRLRPMLCFLVAKATNDAMGLRCGNALRLLVYFSAFSLHFLLYTCLYGCNVEGNVRGPVGCMTV